ncbi:hypothetical protein GCM10008096_08760 [Zhihengliuella salsuginis]|uniref:Uncharacterized protein n=1 Tax=Zhihengliuella salsuginis TaxID=578222 RepID=A0ABQ3GDX7_9MICC|nr:hypothetical protein GCM10008096_08760 [Zhihengliuella salsuginis]
MGWVSPKRYSIMSSHHVTVVFAGAGSLILVTRSGYRNFARLPDTRRPGARIADRRRAAGVD